MSKTRYEVVTADSFKTVKSGFHTQNGAWAWANAHDYGQWEDEGGLMVVEYETEEEG